MKEMAEMEIEESKAEIEEVEQQLQNSFYYRKIQMMNITAI